MNSEHWTDANERKVSGEEFFNEVILKFPTLKDKISEDDIQNVHMRMETFASYTIKQIKGKNWDELKRCFDFQESKVELVNSELLNAMTVSYFEALLLGEVGYMMKEIVPLMGSKLKRLYNEYETYYNDLVERARRNKNNS
jgi:hypothetical protein